ncbi:hypothetical protein BDB01DRAFT_780700 [Pilobolus umbonatus]|nr:hypothetical protein BDB01DRAFT_780700 [Pilobolus umbonatus]
MSPSTTTTTTSVALPLKTWLYALAPRHSIVSMASYMTIGTFTLAAISSLFCLFFVVSMLDDFLTFVSPGRIIAITKDRWLSIDWTGFIDQISGQLTSFAEWEKRKRASWYPDNHRIYNEGDRFHDIISALTSYMNEYVNSKQRERRHHKKRYSSASSSFSYSSESTHSY